MVSPIIIVLSAEPSYYLCFLKFCKVNDIIAKLCDTFLVNIHFSSISCRMNWRNNPMSLSGNSNLESAINWLLEHESDPDIDQLPSVGYFLIMQSLFVSTDLF